MAVVQMQRMNIFGLKADRKQILRAVFLQRYAGPAAAV